MTLGRALASSASGPAAEQAAGEGTASAEVVTYRTDYADYTSLAAIYHRSTVVVEATVGAGSRVERLSLVQDDNDGSDPELNPLAGAPSTEPESPDSSPPDVVTVRTVTVTRVFKGDIQPGATLEVKQLGGEWDGVRYEEEDAVPLRHDAGRYVLFLETYPDVPASLLNPAQAQYLAGANGELRPVAGNALRFSRGQLRRVAGLG